MQIIFILSLILLLYPYGIFPLAMWVASRIKLISWQQREVCPPLTLIISVYNEEHVIEKKLLNSLQLDYPQNQLEVLVVSDDSSDDTHAIVERFSDTRIKLKVVTGRVGKTECLNKVVPEAEGEIVVFTDANSMFPPEALKRISRNFADATIGAVSGWTKYRAVDGGEESTGLYAKLEKITKFGESLISSCVGADGAIFAIRKELFQPLKDYDINDFVIPLNVVDQNKRVILDTDVFCYEAPSQGEMKEYRRQVRITNRTLGAIWRGRRFLNPLRFGSFALFLLSHKVIRFSVPLFFVTTLFLSLVLADMSGFYTLFFCGQLLFIIFGIVGLRGWLDSRLINLCAFFLLTIVAQSVGWFRFFVGKRDTVWTPQR